MKGRVTINEDASNVPKELMEVFNQHNMDADSYKEMERLKRKAKEIGYDFDFGLCGTPTEFWTIDSGHKESGLLDQIRWWETNTQEHHIRGSFNRELYSKIYQIKSKRYVQNHRSRGKEV